MEMWKWAFRNLWRQKRRTFLNAASLSLGMAFLFMGLGWLGGYNAFLFRGIQDFDTGQAQLIRPDYLENERRLPLDKSLAAYSQLRSQLKSTDGVSEASGRLDFPVKLSFHGKSTQLLGRAVDYNAEHGVTILAKQIAKGRYDDEPGALISRKIADRWGLTVGDTVYLTALDSHGALNFVDIRVKGLFEFGYDPIDTQIVFLDLATAWNLLDMPDQVSRIVLRLNPDVDPQTWVSHHQSNTPENGQFFPWQRFARETVAAVASDTGSFYFILVVIFILATLGMLNSMSMSVHERRKELGTLRALGLRRRGVLGLILREGVALGLVSLAVAALLSIPVVIWLGGIGLDMRGVIPPELPFPFGDRFKAVFGPSSYLITIAAGGLAALVGGILPARRASKLVIIEALAGRSR